MIQMKRILVPTDYSEFSQNAVRYGCELASRFEAELHLLYVMEDTTTMFPDPEVSMLPLAEIVADQEKYAHQKLEATPESGLDDKIQVVRVVKQGNAFVEIVRYAKNEGIDLVVLGTHGRSGLAHALLGSVAEKVVRKAPCPVLTVHHPEHEFVLP